LRKIIIKTFNRENYCGNYRTKIKQKPSCSSNPFKYH